MTYQVLTSTYNSNVSGILDGNTAIPLDHANRHYQEVLDSINTYGADAWDDTVATYDDIPEALRTAAESKKFDQQLADYEVALARLEEYEVANGRSEETETVVVGQEWDEDAQDYIDVTETRIVKEAIDPVEATITRLVFSEDDPAAEPTEEPIENPLITKDKEERAAAQAVVDSTPQAVKDAI